MMATMLQKGDGGDHETTAKRGVADVRTLTNVLILSSDANDQTSLWSAAAD